MQGSFFNNNLDNVKQYIVKQNDTLYNIAKMYNTTVDTLKSYNHLVSNMIYPNQILFIPLEETVTTNYGNTYTTKSGDNLQHIIDKYNLELEDLDEYNDLGKLKLEPNQLLMVDKRNQQQKIHIVRPNERIEDILAKYNISPMEFLKLNEQKILNANEKIIIG